MSTHVGRNFSEHCGEERVEVKSWYARVLKCNVKADGGAVDAIRNFA